MTTIIFFFALVLTLLFLQGWLANFLVTIQGHKNRNAISELCTGLIAVLFWAWLYWLSH
jgi:hypothetical protein